MIPFENRFNGVLAKAQQVGDILGYHLSRQSEGVTLKRLGVLAPWLGDLNVD